MSTEQKASFLDILHLTSQAWDAYYQKRTRECLALAKALQQADPENTEAHAIQSAVRSDLQKDINDARILLEASGDTEETRKHRKTAEVMLLKVLYLDPDNKEAKVLLSAAKAMQGSNSSLPASSFLPPAPAPAAQESKAPNSGIMALEAERAREITPVPALASIVSLAPTRLAEPVEVSERVAIETSATETEAETPKAIETPLEYKPSATETPLAFQSPIPAAIVSPAPAPVPVPAPVDPVVEPSPVFSTIPAKTTAPAAPVFQLAAPASRPENTERADTFFVAQEPVQRKTEKNSRSRVPFIFGVIVLVIAGLVFSRYMQTRGQNTSKADAAAAAFVPAPVVSAPAPAPWTPPIISEKLPTPPPAPKKEAPTVSVVAPRPAPIYVPTPAPVETGSLAVSSPTAAEIYQGDKLLGSTPTTLDLPAGTYTLEYRHDNLRTTATHVVKAKQTTTALITFETVVQINARPWAQVYIDGAQRQALGQTPLSNVRVPIGRILVFENPGFPAKTYRVTGNEKAIQMIFP